MKSIPAIGVANDADTIWLDGEIKVRGINPAWNHGLDQETSVVLVCVTDNFDYANLTDAQKIVLYKTWERRVLIASFAPGKMPRCLADIMALDFGKDSRACLVRLAEVIDSLIA